MKLKIRGGEAKDAGRAMDVIRRSIVELCEADHQNDAKEITEWLLNKTEDNWMKWVSNPRGVVFVAEQESQLVGVGMVDAEGMILLNYVHPDARYKGVSKALLAAMEIHALDRGLGRCALQSTHTALGFYQRCGYSPIPGSEPTELFLEKQLIPAPDQTTRQPT